MNKNDLCEPRFLYEPINDKEEDAITDGIQLWLNGDRKSNTTLYFVKTNGRQSIKLQEKQYNIISCEESYHILHYRCDDGVEIVFIRVFDYIEIFVKRDGKVYHYFIIVSKQPFNKLSADMIDKIEKLFN